jgi:hypothetical protein
VLTENLKRGTDKDILAARDGNVYLLYHTTEKIFVSSRTTAARTGHSQIR